MKIIWLLSLLFTIFLLIVAIALLVWLTFQKRWLSAIKVILGLAAWCLVYLVVLGTVSILSPVRVIAVTQPKQFGGFYLDRDLSAATQKIDKVSSIDGPAGHLQASGKFYIIQLQITSTAVRVSLGLENPRAWVEDANGRIYQRDLRAESALAAAKGIVNPPLAKVLWPGQSFVVDLVFDLPDDAVRPRLIITEGDEFERILALFLIGDENSLWHRPEGFCVD